MTSQWWRVAGRIRGIRLEDPQLRTGVAHLAALVVTVLVLAGQRPWRPPQGDLAVAIVIAGALVVLRVLSVRKRLAYGTLALDAAGTVILLSGTGAPVSPFYPLALAGVWWAAHIPRRHSGAIYGLIFAVAYLLLVVPQASRSVLLGEAIEDSTVVVIVALLSDWFVRVDRRALQLNAALDSTALEANPLAIREGLQRALGISHVPVDVVLAAAQVGLTAVQAELLAYLVVGLTNREIADATSLSEATVRYRLTRLYRALGVERRGEAVIRARALGLELSAPNDH